MTLRSRDGIVAIGIACVVIGVAACDDSGSVLPVPDAGSDASLLVDPAIIGRGEYLVRNVAACHTPRDEQGNLDMSRWLSGVDVRFDLAPFDDAVGATGTPNLTTHASGLATWTDDQIRHAILDGVDKDGAPLEALMPSYVFHNMTSDDARAIVAYLRSIPPIDHTVPAGQPLPVPITAPPTPLPDSAIPHTTLASTDPNFAHAEHGRYLAASVGACINCHTQWHYDAAMPLDVASLFAGNRPFSAKEWGVPPPAPAVIYSYNITPHASGIAGWTAAMVVKAITTGRDDNDALLCRPMPFGPMGSFGGMTADDAFDIGTYITTLPPIDSGDIPRCPRE
jgi:hypothetical protein